MKTNDIESPGEVRIPGLQVGSGWKRVIRRLSSIKCGYCAIGFTALLALSVLLMPGYIREALWLRIRGQRILLSLLLVFSIVAVSLVWKTGQRMDVWVFKVFNMRWKRPPWIDKAMLALTQAGSSVFALVLGVVIFFVRDQLLAFEIILGTLTLWIAVEFIKILFQRSRPYTELKGIRILGERAGGTSFPSGHTSQSFFMAALLSNHFNAGLPGVVIFYAAALLVGITRIYVGMHYPRDVIGGAVFGTFWGLLGVTVNQYIR